MLLLHSRLAPELVTGTVKKVNNLEQRFWSIELTSSRQRALFTFGVHLAQSSLSAAGQLYASKPLLQVVYFFLRFQWQPQTYLNLPTPKWDTTLYGTKPKMWQNWKTQNVTKLKKSKCDNSKTQDMTKLKIWKLKNSKCDKTKKLKMWKISSKCYKTPNLKMCQNLNSQILQNSKT